RIHTCITDSVLEDVIGEIPPEWYEDDYDGLLRLVEQLCRRRMRIPELLLAARQSNRQPFPNWKGDWPNTRTLVTRRCATAGTRYRPKTVLATNHVSVPCCSDRVVPRGSNEERPSGPFEENKKARQGGPRQRRAQTSKRRLP